MSTYLYSSLNANNSCYCYDAKGSQFSKIGKNSATKISSPSVENGGFLHTYFTNILQLYIFFDFNPLQLLLTSSYYIVCAWMNFVSARRKKGKVKYTKILKKGALGEFKLGYKFAYISNGLSKNTNILKNMPAYLFWLFFLFLKHTMKGEPKVNLSIASSRGCLVLQGQLVNIFANLFTTSMAIDVY